MSYSYGDWAVAERLRFIEATHKPEVFSFFELIDDKAKGCAALTINKDRITCSPTGELEPDHHFLSDVFVCRRLCKLASNDGVECNPLHKSQRMMRIRCCRPIREKAAFLKCVHPHASNRLRLVPLKGRLDVGSLGEIQFVLSLIFHFLSKARS